MPNLITSEECTSKYNFLNIFCNLRYTRIIQFESKIKIARVYIGHITLSLHNTIEAIKSYYSHLGLSGN